MAQLDLHIATIGPPVEIPGNDLKNLWFLRLSFCLGYTSLRIQICPEKGIEPRILLWGWDWDHQTYSRDGSGFLGHVGTVGCKRKKFQTIFSQMVVGFLLIFILWDRIRTKKSWTTNPRWPFKETSSQTDVPKQVTLFTLDIADARNIHEKNHDGYRPGIVGFIFKKNTKHRSKGGSSSISWIYLEDHPS